MIEFDRRLGVRFVAGADEVGRGSLAGPLVAAGVVFDYERLRGASTRPLATLDDSKRCGASEREELFRAVVASAELTVVEVIPAGEIDRRGLHEANLEALRRVLRACSPPAELCLVDGLRLGPDAPPHEVLVSGDARSAAIAAASIVAKVVRDRAMRRLDGVFPRYGFAAHVGYITKDHAAAVRRHGPSAVHRRSFRAGCYEKTA